MIGGVRTCLGVSDDPMFLWISSNSCPLNLLLVRSHQAEIIIIVKRLIQGRNSVTRVRVEPRSFDQGRRKNDAFTYSATLPTSYSSPLPIRPRCRLLILPSIGDTIAKRSKFSLGWWKHHETKSIRISNYFATCLFAVVVNSSGSQLHKTQY